MGHFASVFSSSSPAAQLKRNRHACRAEFIRMVAIEQGASHDHSSYGHGRNTLSRNPTRGTFPVQTALQHVHHRPEYCFEGNSRSLTATSYVRWQRNHGARVFNVFIVLSR